MKEIVSIMENKKIKVFKIVVLIAFLAIMVFLTIQLLPIFKNIATEEGRIKFKDDIESLGRKRRFCDSWTYGCSNILANFTRRAS